MAASCGGSKCTTPATPSTCTPRAATSVAINERTSPRANARRARSRWGWLRPPWIGVALTPSLSSCLVSRSAPWRVRQNTIVEPIALIAPAVASARSVRSTCQKMWRAAVMSGPCAPTSWTTGSRWMSAASADTALSNVAENRSTWRRALVSSRMRRRAGRKPMSAMRSASSTTTRSTSPSDTRPDWIRSSSRPGQATTNSAPASSALRCGP